MRRIVGDGVNIIVKTAKPNTILISGLPFRNRLDITPVNNELGNSSVITDWLNLPDNAFRVRLSDKSKFEFDLARVIYAAFCQGYNAGKRDIIDYVLIDTLSDAVDFGDAGVVGYYGSACSNGANDRGVFGGSNPYEDYLGYITITTPSNAIDFGELTWDYYNIGATSNGINERGVFAGGYSFKDTIQYITINTPSNSLDFGNLLAGNQGMGACSNGANDRGVFGGGWAGGAIDYITINTLSDSINFGNLVVERADLAATSNDTNERGVFAGGNEYFDVIEYVTINTPSDSLDFGDLTVARNKLAGCSSGINERGVFGGGNVGGATPYNNTIDYITINTLGNAADFGDLTLGRDGVAACSNA